jgi:hypothetical protein
LALCPPKASYMVKYQTPEKIKLKFDTINKEKAGHLLSHGRLYGDMLCQDTAEGFLVVDGHHRLSTLYAMGIKLAGIKTCI